MAYATTPVYQTASEAARISVNLETCLERLRGLYGYINSLEQIADRTVGAAVVGLEGNPKAPAQPALLYAIDEEISNLTGRLDSLANRLGNLA